MIQNCSILGVCVGLPGPSYLTEEKIQIAGENYMKHPFHFTFTDFYRTFTDFSMHLLSGTKKDNCYRCHGVQQARDHEEKEHGRAFNESLQYFRIDDDCFYATARQREVILLFLIHAVVCD